MAEPLLGKRFWVVPECSVSKWLITEVGCKLRTPEISLVRSIKVQRGRV